MRGELADPTVLPGSGLLVQCLRSLTSSCGGQRWLLLGHCAPLINVPVLWQLCVWCHSLQQTATALQKHTHTYTLRVIRPVCLTPSPSLSPVPFPFLPTILPQTDAGAHRRRFIADTRTNTHTYPQVCCFHLLLCAQTVCISWLHISASAYAHLHTPSQEREREGGEVERRFRFRFSMNGNFCSALVFAALPIRPVLSL